MAVDFYGLIVTAWIASAAVGSTMGVSTHHKTGGVVVIALIILVFILSIRSYFAILALHRKKETVRRL